MNAVSYLVRLILVLLPLSASSQINRYLPDTWKPQPEPAAATGSGPNYTLLHYAIVRDFNIPESDRQLYITHYKTVYRHIRANRPSPSDSLTQLVIPLERNESYRSAQARISYADGSTLNIRPQMARLKDGREALVLAPLQMKPGSELEYDLTLKESEDYAGADIMQSTMPCERADYMLVAPADLLFHHKSSNGFPALTSSSENGVQRLKATSGPIPGLQPDNGLYYYQPRLQRVEFALHAEAGKKDTAYNTWQHQGEQLYLQYVSIEQQEYRRLQKELKKWSFLQRNPPLPTLIYQVEQYIKTHYRLVPVADQYELADLSSILHSQNANEAGMVRLMAAVYDMLGIRCQLLFTTARDEVPLDSNLVNLKPAQHVLLYFPTLGQALSPTETSTRFPLYPPGWCNTLALRCRDTLQNNERVVLTDMVQTPQPDYTLHNISLEATLRLNAAHDSLRLQTTQTYGGFPATILRETLSGKKEEEKKTAYESLLPALPEQRSVHSLQAANESWPDYQPNQPFTLKSIMDAGGLLSNEQGKLQIRIGQLLANALQRQALPPDGIPVEMVYPFYQEKRLYLELPAGYKVANIADFNTDIHYNEGNTAALGSKITCRQENNRLNIYAIEWYRQTIYDGEARNTFRKILEGADTLRDKVLVLEKM
jgi:hypothetical protein